MTIYYPQTQYSTSVIQTMVAGDYTYVLPGVSLTTSGTAAISEPSYGTINIQGTVVGGNAIVIQGSYGGHSYINVGKSGSVSSTSGAAIFNSGGDHYITNAGNIDGLSDNGEGVVVGGPGQIVNYGEINGYYGIYDDDDGSETSFISNYGSIVGYKYGIYDAYTHYSYINNYGTISANDYSTYNYAIYSNGSSVYLENFGTISGDVMLGSLASTLTNEGLIDGNLDMGSADGSYALNKGRITGSVSIGEYGVGQVFNSSLGEGANTIRIGSHGGTVIMGTSGGSVSGTSGEDIIQANASQASASNHVHFVLDGGGGINALYGGGAFNTFEAGDAAGGHNQIHGGLSLMTDIAGYANNTLDLGATPSSRSVYVDLLNGHNAYLYAGPNHTGALTFEDAIRNVPNVTGSAGGDLIRADNTGDLIQGGGGGDILYAGTGADTFVYKYYGDSNTVNGYDTISGFKTASDKLDLSAFNADPTQLAILNSSTSTTLYLEHTSGHFNANTDLAISFAGANAINTRDVIL